MSEDRTNTGREMNREEASVKAKNKGEM